MRGCGDGVGLFQEGDFVGVLGDAAGVDGGVEGCFVEGWEGGGEVGGGRGMSPRPVVKRVVPGPPSSRRWEGRASEVWQASMSYFERAWGEREAGRPR